MDIAQQSEIRRDFSPILLFALTLFCSAFLMFVLQPMFGKVLLPLLGGAASVWNTCMVFYQAVVFLGYLYAHVLCNRFSNKRQLLIHGVLLLASLSYLPINNAGQSAPPTDANPTLWLLSTLLVSIGLPFFIISTTSPLLQKWFSRLGHQTSRDPYYLSMASNTGSLIALLSYPFLIESSIGLNDQQQIWSLGFVALCTLVFLCIMQFKRHGVGTNEVGHHVSTLTASPGFKLKLEWLLLSFVPSSLLLGTTNYISIDIASVPLLWVIPLALYLLSFIIVFSKNAGRIHKAIIFLQPAIVTPFLIYYFSKQKLAFFSLELALHFVVFFISIMLCHGELAKKRPEPSYLTHYYLIMSFGGMLGGIFNNFVTPFIFDSIYEYPLMIIAALLFNPTNKSHVLYLKRNLSTLVFACYMLFFGTIFYLNSDRLANELILAALIAVVIANYLLFHKNLLYLALYSTVIVSCATPIIPGNNQTLYQDRNFYGILTIKKNIVNLDAQAVTRHELYSGTTEHGAQIVSDDNLQRIAIGYYSPQGPLGQLFDLYDRTNEHWRIGVVGLGTGALAAYAKEQQYWRFYELNPSVVEIATNPEYFNYLNDSASHFDIQIGDARLQLEKDSPQRYDLLVIDAFNSDSIPTHLLTREAIALYFSRLNTDGLLVFHVSNRHLELKRVLAEHAKTQNSIALIQEFRPEQKMPYTHKSDWVVLAKNENAIKPLLQSHLGAWQRLQPYADHKVWTDDFASIINIWK